MKIALGYRLDIRHKPIETYARSFHFALEKLGHEVTPVGQGHEVQEYSDGYDLLLDIDSGRDDKGNLVFKAAESDLTIPKAVWFVDSHGNPDLHEKLAPKYNHVFFAVWSKRDLFAKHLSVHFCPNATDLKWFGWKNFIDVESKEFDFGFFGSKKGLHRATPLIRACETYNWSHNVKQVSKPYRHKWPQTGQAMARCKYLFNHGQKHDLNLRIFETMAIMKPLLNDFDLASGITKLFKPEIHFIPYESYTYEGLEERMKWMMENPIACFKIAMKAYEEVSKKHLVYNRAEQIMEVVS